MPQGCHLPRPLPVPQVRSKRLLPTLNSVNMAVMVLGESLLCHRSHMKDSTSKPHRPKAHSMATSSRKPSRQPKPVLSHPHQMISPHTIPLTLSSGMLIITTTSSNMVSKVHRPNRRPLHNNRGPSADMVARRPKAPPNSLRALRKPRNRDMPLLERVRTAATPHPIQLRKLNSLVLLRPLSLSPATHNNRRPQATLMATLTTRAHTTPNI